jgi:hypothetical protein
MRAERSYGILRRTADDLIVSSFSRVFETVMFLLRRVKRAGGNR